MEKIHKKVLETKTEIFYGQRSLLSLARLLNTDATIFEIRLNHPVYTPNRIPKKKGGWREILVPEKELMKIQTNLNYYLQMAYTLIKPDCVHGFLIRDINRENSRGIVSNAKQHIGKAFLLNLDLKDFFPSISAKRIKQQLFNESKLFANEAVVNAITLLCTYQGYLPTGAPTSPVISNFICLQLDKSLMAFCAERNITYTRYADDLSFSSDNYFTDDCINDLKKLIEQYHFKINEKKFRINSSKSKQTVTGLVVNTKVNLDRRYIRNIRACLYNWRMNGLEHATAKHYQVISPDMEKQTEFANKLKGQVEFVGMVRGSEDEIYKRYRRDLKYLIKAYVTG
jgi:RNA-directed DNA polymerase